MIKKNLLWIGIILMMMACEADYLPRPKGYNRIDLPDRSFSRLEGEFPYQFEVSDHALVEPDSFNLAEKAWIILNYPDLGAKIHLTYLPLGSGNKDLKMVLSDAINLTAKHQVKAYGIEESVLLTPLGYTGVVAELSGEVPTQFQFFVTDSTENFLRGALYFNTAMKNDSLAPVIEYLKVDMVHLMNTLEFQE